MPQFYTTEAIMSEAGIVLSDYTEEETKKPKKSSTEKEKIPTVKTPSTSKVKNDQIKDMTSEQLKLALGDALGREDYEAAAAIRDEMNKRN
jgi:protein-arginine kinase activator protein McsA